MEDQGAEDLDAQKPFIFKDGEPVTSPPTDGVYEIHQSDGRLVVTYKDGKKNGETIIYDKDNKISHRIIYQENQLHGQAVTYLGDGTTVETTMTYQNNALEGPMVGYYSSGVKRLAGSYAKGKLEGEFTFYDEFGDICQKTAYKNGLQHGASVTYFPKSQGGGICQVSRYESGLLVQNQDMFYATGELLQRTPYQKGKATAYPAVLGKDGKPLANPANKNRGSIL